MFILLTKDIY